VVESAAAVDCCCCEGRAWRLLGVAAATAACLLLRVYLGGVVAHWRRNLPALCCSSVCMPESLNGSRGV
jgi:hypothetical protein